MSENNSNENVEVENDYAFVILKRKDGVYGVQPIDNDSVERPSTLDEIYGACAIIMRNIEAQHSANALHQVMLEAVKQAAEEEGKSDLIIPEIRPVKGN